jgi:hypothetical protein
LANIVYPKRVKAAYKATEVEENKHAERRRTRGFAEHIENLKLRSKRKKKGRYTVDLDAGKLVDMFMYIYTSMS